VTRSTSMPEPSTPKRAVGLRYDGTGAPKVVAHGRDLIAQRILEEAQKAGVPIREDAALVQALANLELGTEISEELYAAVAEALAWAYALDRAGPPGASRRR
jgi:flagellar biosynthesis protein